ncbi:MAG TPA: glycosyltransferase [Acidobacteriota bacterium]|nr:glycosyltransferase [Acidobacteriota bacterium]
MDVYADRLARALMGLGHHPVVVALEPVPNGVRREIGIEQEEWNGLQVVRIKFDLATRKKEAFDTLYDRELLDILKQILKSEQPQLFIVMNFYLLTLAAVEAAKSSDLPVFHIATDFLSICRRGTLIRWDGSPCSEGQSLKACTRCFLSHRVLGRIGSYWLNKLPDPILLAGARRVDSASKHTAIQLAKPFLRQLLIMNKRLEIVSRLRKKIDRVLAPTLFTTRMYLQGGFSENQLSYLPFGVDPSGPLSRVRRTRSEKRRFLFIGRLQPYKGLHVLLEAFNGLKEPHDAVVTVYGATDGHPDYVRRIQLMMDQNPHICFKGPLPPDKLASAFAETDYFVLPSLWHENSPLIVLDALQSKTPVIASDVGGVTDLISNGKNGLLFPMGSTRNLREILQRLIDDPDPGAAFQMETPLMSINDYARRVVGFFNNTPQGRLP